MNRGRYQHQAYTLLMPLRRKSKTKGKKTNGASCLPPELYALIRANQTKRHEKRRRSKKYLSVVAPKGHSSLQGGGVLMVRRALLLPPTHPAPLGKKRDKEPTRRFPEGSRPRRVQWARAHCTSPLRRDGTGASCLAPPLAPQWRHCGGLHGPGHGTTKRTEIAMCASPWTCPP